MSAEQPPIVYGEVRVAEVWQRAKSVRRIVLTGDVLRGYTPGRPAEAFRLMLAPEGSERVDFPHTGSDGLPYWNDDQARPSLRAQTVRTARPGEIGLDVMEREDTTWPSHLQVGDLVGIAGMRFGYAGVGHSRAVLVGDRGALPALSAIVQSGSVARFDVLLVGELADDELALVPAGQHVQRVSSPDGVAEALRTLRGEDVEHVYAAGEVRVAAAGYRAGRDLFGLGPDRLQPVVYWERGLTADERDPMVYERYQRAAEVGRDVSDPLLVADLELEPVRT